MGDEETFELTYPVEGTASLTLTEEAIRAVAACPTDIGFFGPGVVAACRRWLSERNEEAQRLVDAHRRMEAIAEHRLSQGLPAMEWHEVPFGDGVALDETPDSKRRFRNATRAWTFTAQRRWWLWWVGEARWTSEQGPVDTSVTSTGLCWSRGAALMQAQLIRHRSEAAA